jgi:MFS family permease
VVSIAALVILGLSFGPIYPTAIAMATERFSQAAGAVTSRIQAIASLGGMALSWMLGVVLTRHGTFAFAFVMTMFTAAMWGSAGTFVAVSGRTPWRPSIPRLPCEVAVRLHLAGPEGPVHRKTALESCAA